MAKMGCGKCDYTMKDHDGSIVYDVFSLEKINNAIEKQPNIKKIEDLFEYDYELNIASGYLWLCDICKTAHVWSGENEECLRIYELVDILNETFSIEAIKKLDEYFIININDYSDELDNTPIEDFIKYNSLRPYKYYLTKDLITLYIINTDRNEIDRIYKLKEEVFSKYHVETKSSGNILFYTITKTNDLDDYVIEKGKRIKKDKENDFPHIQVNFMVNDNGISFPDPNKPSETYNKNTMKEFNEKYGKDYYK